jgi:hypothetical protein
VNWNESDYLQSCLPWPARIDTQVTLPLGTTAPVTGIGKTDRTFGGSSASVYETGSGATTTTYTYYTDMDLDTALVMKGSAATDANPEVYADLSNATATSIINLREAVAKQSFYELLAHTGSRYIEFNRNVFGAHSSDKSLSRPQLVGGNTTPMIISEVLQTGETGTTAQGTMAGHGISPHGTDHYTEYYCEEHGWLMTMLFIVPDVVYQEGLDRKFRRTTRLDYAIPQLSLIGDQAVLNEEAYAEHTTPSGIFGYARRYAEYMHERSRVHGDFISAAPNTLEHWHLAIDLASDPSLNSTFITCTPDISRIFAQSTTDNVLAQVVNDVQVIRALPRMDSPYRLL